MKGWKGWTNALIVYDSGASAVPSLSGLSRTAFHLNWEARKFNFKIRICNWNAPSTQISNSESWRALPALISQSKMAAVNIYSKTVKPVICAHTVVCDSLHKPCTASFYL